MSAEENKATANAIVQAINNNDWDTLSNIFDANYIEHSLPPGLPPGFEGFKIFFGALRSAFPDFHYHNDDTLADGDKAIQRLTGHGTMQGSLMGMPATGKHAEWTEIHIGRFQDGKLVEHWAVVDQLGMLQQLGLVPTPGQ